MAERKPSAHDLANEYVVHLESEFRKTHHALGKALISAGDSDEAQKEINLLRKEGDRLVEPGFDEEEWRIGNISRKKK